KRRGERLVRREPVRHRTLRGGWAAIDFTSSCRRQPSTEQRGMPGRRTILAGGAAALAAPGLARSQGKSVLKFVPAADLSVLDPVWTTTYQSRDHGFLVFDTLFGLDASFRAQPQMAAGAVSEDQGKTWRISLRDGLLFHDA